METMKFHQQCGGDVHAGREKLLDRNAVGSLVKISNHISFENIWVLCMWTVNICVSIGVECEDGRHFPIWTMFLYVGLKRGKKMNRQHNQNI